MLRQGRFTEAFSGVARHATHGLAVLFQVIVLDERTETFALGAGDSMFTIDGDRDGVLQPRSMRTEIGGDLRH